MFVKFKHVGTKGMYPLLLNSGWSQYSQVAGWHSRQSCSLEWYCPGFFRISIPGMPSMGLRSLSSDSSCNGSETPPPALPKLSPLIDHKRGSHFLCRGGLFYPQFIVQPKVTRLTCISASFLLQNLPGDSLIFLPELSRKSFLGGFKIADPNSNNSIASSRKRRVTLLQS